MLTTVLSSAVHAATPTLSHSREHFELGNAMDKLRTNTANGENVIVNVIVFVIIILIIAFVGKFLWNATVAGAGNSGGLLSFAKPATSIWQILGFYILISLFMGR